MASKNDILPISSAQIFTLPPPFYNVPNIQNLRSVEGIPLPSHKPANTTSNQCTIRPKVIFRSANPYLADPSSLSELGISTIFDLRSAPEVSKNPLGWIGGGEAEVAEKYGIRRVWCPVFEAEDYSPERLVGRFAMYMSEGVEVSHCYDIVQPFTYKSFPTVPSIFSLSDSSKSMRCQFP
jgi:hypothetical protein